MHTLRSEREMGARGRLRTGSALALLPIAASLALAGCAAAESTQGGADTGSIIRVPEDVGTISEAVAQAEAGDMVLVGAGIHTEQVQIETPDITVRGVDRNATIIDAEGVRPYGIVAIADGVRIENLTVRGATFYGVLVTGLHDENGPSARGVDGYTRLDPEKFPPLQRFAIDHVTAHNNGLYGIYAFNSQHGVIRGSYASGSADSGIYVGQCGECDILVTDNVAERNAIGFENANASDSLVIVGNRFTGNRIGATLISSYQEAFTPQHSNTVVGNLISDNASADSPAQAEGGFGVGLGISGGQDNLVERNTIQGNPRAGVEFSSVEDIASTGNQLNGNFFTDNGYDVVNTASSRTPASGNCATDEAGAPAPLTQLPAGLLDSCAGEQPAATNADLPTLTVPAGVSFLKVQPPRAQPSLADVEALPARLPATVQLPDLASYRAPDGSFLADRAGSA